MGRVGELALWVGETLTMGSREQVSSTLSVALLACEHPMKGTACYRSVSGNTPCPEVPRTTSCNPKIAFKILESMGSPQAPPVHIPTSLLFLQDLGKPAWDAGLWCTPASDSQLSDSTNRTDVTVEDSVSAMGSKWADWCSHVSLELPQSLCPTRGWVHSTGEEHKC